MKQIILIIISFLVLSSCRKNETNAPQGPQGPQGPSGPVGSVPTGTITGRITQYDEFDVKLTTGLNTVTVSIKGTSLKAVSDEKGVYSIDSVPAGIYVLEFKGSNTQIFKNDQVSFTGNGITYVDATLYNKPSWSFTQASIKDTLYGTHSIKISANFTPNVWTTDRYLFVIFGTNPALVNTEPSTYDYVVLTKKASTYIAYNEVSTIEDVFVSPGYPAGTVYYAKLYAITSLKAAYYDNATQEYVSYSNGDASQTFTLTMP